MEVSSLENTKRPTLNEIAQKHRALIRWAAKKSKVRHAGLRDVPIEDIEQEMWLQICKYYDSTGGSRYNPERSSISSWLVMVGLTAATKLSMRQRHDTIISTAMKNSLEFSYTYEPNRHDVEVALRHLPRHMRLIVALTLQLEMSIEEAAETIENALPDTDYWHQWILLPPQRRRQVLRHLKTTVLAKLKKVGQDLHTADLIRKGPHLCPLDDCPLPPMALDELRGHGAESLADVLKLTPTDILGLPSMGMKKLQEFTLWLQQFSLHLARPNEPSMDTIRRKD